MSWNAGMSPEKIKRVEQNRQFRMMRIDAMPKELRVLVHEYSLTVVDAFLAAGVSKPKHIRHIVERVLDAFSPTRGGGPKQGPRTSLEPAFKNFDPEAP